MSEPMSIYVQDTLSCTTRQVDVEVEDNDEGLYNGDLIIESKKQKKISIRILSKNSNQYIHIETNSFKNMIFIISYSKHDNKWDVQIGRLYNSHLLNWSVGYSQY